MLRYPGFACRESSIAAPRKENNLNRVFDQLESVGHGGDEPKAIFVREAIYSPAAAELALPPLVTCVRIVTLGERDGVYERQQQKCTLAIEHNSATSSVENWV